MGHVVGGGERRQQREADDHFGIDRAVGADARGGFGLAAADRFDSKLDGARPRRAGGRKRNRGALGAELLSHMVGHRAEQEAPVIGGEISAAAQQVGVSELVFGAGPLADGDTLWPTDFDWRHGEEQWAREVAGAADSGFCDRLLGGGGGGSFGPL